MAAAKGSRALYGTRAALENAQKESDRKYSKVPVIRMSGTDDGISRQWLEDNPDYKPTRGGSKLSGTLARKKAADEAAKKSEAKKYAKGGKVSSASKRADGCATKGKTKGRFV